MRLALQIAAIGVATASQGLAQGLFRTSPEVTFPGTIFATRTVVFGDVDGDGDQDVIFGDANGPLQLLANTGLGALVDVSATNVPGPSPAVDLALGDLDGDGDLDLVLGAPAQNRILDNDGTGRFVDVTAARLPLGRTQTQSVELADVDQDGDLDLLAAAQPNRLFLNDGFGAFVDASAQLPPSTIFQPTDIVAADIDGDRDLDVVVVAAYSSFSRNELYRNDGTGRFTTVPFWPNEASHSRAAAWGDVDADGDLDLAIARDGYPNRLFVNDGSGALTDVSAAQLPIDTDRTAAIELVDIDRDGDLDLVMGNDSQEHPDRLYLNDGSGRFTDAPENISSDRFAVSAIDFADLDGDGDLDQALAVVGQNRVYLNDGGGRLINPSPDRFPILASAVAAGDLDSDGDLDLLTQREVLLNDGAGYFEVGSRRPFTQFFGELVLADLDADGDLDAVTIARGVFGGARNSLLVNDGRGQFTSASGFPNRFTRSLDVAVADFNGDGASDIVFADLGVANQLLLNDGSGNFVDASARLPSRPLLTRAVAAGDVDGDGDLDLVFGNDNEQNVLLLNDGTARFSNQSATRMPVDTDHTDSLELADLDGDGDLDLVVGNGVNPSGQANRLYRNDNAGHFVDVTSIALPADIDVTAGILARDFDEDGDLDLVLDHGGAAGGRNRYYRNNGVGQFTDRTAMDLPAIDSGTLTLVAGDLDLDGDLDLLLDGELVINFHRQLDAPGTAHLGQSVPLRITARPGMATPQVAALLINTTRQSTPLFIAPFGFVSVGLVGVIDLPAVSLSVPGGVAVVPVAIPNLPSLIGMPLVSQAVIAHGQAVGSVRLSNLLTVPILN